MWPKILRILRHTLSLFFLLGFALLFFKGSALEKARAAFTLPNYWVFCLSLIGLAYLNYYFLIPRFYLRKKYSLYVLIIFGLFVFFYLLKPFHRMYQQYSERLGESPRHAEWLDVDLFSCIFFIVLVTANVALRSYRHSREIERRVLQAEAEKANAELSFLKAQVNPHFLYNTLNNIYSLSQDNHPDTSESILKLSNIMRYITDEATHDKVPLANELEITRDYVDLQKLRLADNTTVVFEITGDPDNKKIAPLILITYIENAFKYGISARQEATITIRVTIEDKVITFFCQNQQFPTASPRERIGIGLENTRQRLKILYPNKHHLNINTDHGLYTVELTLLA